MRIITRLFPGRREPSTIHQRPLGAYLLSAAGGAPILPSFLTDPILGPPQGRKVQACLLCFSCLLGDERRHVWENKSADRDAKDRGIVDRAGPRIPEI